MAQLTKQVLDAMTYGVGIAMLSGRTEYVPYADFFKLPEPGEREGYSAAALGFRLMSRYISSAFKYLKRFTG